MINISETDPISENNKNETNVTPTSEEQFDFTSFSLNELIDKTKELIKVELVYTVSKDIERLKALFYKKLNEEKSMARTSFLEDGGEESLFVFDNSLESSFKNIYNDFKHKKAAFRVQQEKSFASNLHIKKSIIEEIDALTKGQETIKETFEHFRALQEKWRNTGAVSPAYNHELWQSYHHHVELFYDFISINNDLRDLDFKRNLTRKSELCEKAEALTNEKSLNKAHERLQELHTIWKEIGPVKRELRENIWERFKAATRVIHKKRNDYFLELKEKNLKAAEKKEEICQQIEALFATPIESHSAWQKASQSLQELEKDWKEIGRLDKLENKKAWNRLRLVLNDFYQQKNEFYKERKNTLKNEVDKKIALCEQAEALKDSTDWKETTEKIISLQKAWKKTSFVPKGQSEKIWKRFQNACNSFFDQKKSFYKELDAKKTTNLKDKKNFLESLKQKSFAKDEKELLSELKKINKEWSALGTVPRGKESIDKEFQKIMQGFYNALNIDPLKLAELKFRNKLESIKNDSYKIDIEQKSIQKSISEKEQEVRQYENNMSFFSNSKGTEKLKKQVLKKIDSGRDQIKTLKKQLRLIKEL
jgi:hypothetical protein